MSNRLRTTLVFSLCMTSPWLTACDTPSDDALGQRGELAVVAWPAGAAERELDVRGEFAVMPRSAGQHKPSETLAIGWVRWALAQPWSTGPVNDPTGERCAMGQSGPVWFLAGTSGGAVTRECDIPMGKQLLLPLVNSWWTFPVEFYPTEADQEAGVPDSLAWLQDNFDHVCTLTLRIDGEDVFPGGFDDMVDALYVETFEPFEIELNSDDHYMTQYGVAGGSMLATGAGYYARIQPLPPGDHVIELGGSICDGDDLWFETAATYHLHVGG